MKNRLTRMLSFLLIVATLCSLLGVFASAVTEVDSSVRMIYNRKFNEGWDYTNGMGGGSGLSPFINHEYDDNYDYNYYLEVTENETSTGGGDLSISLDKYIPSSGKTVLSFSLKLPSDSNQDYGTVISAKTKPGEIYDLLSIKDNQLTSLGAALGTVYNDEWIDFEFIMDWDDSHRVCQINVEGGGLSVSAEAPLAAGPSGTSLQYVYVGMDGRTQGMPTRTYGIDNLVLYNTGTKIVAEEDLDLYGLGFLVKENIAKTIEIYGETILAPTDYIKKGLTMKVNVNYYMTDVLVDKDRGKYEHTKLNIYETEAGQAYGAPVKIDGVVYVPLELILDYTGYEYRIRENSVEISTGGTTSVCITFGSKSASVNGQRVELAGAPGFASAEIKGEEYKYIVIPLDNVETFFAQEGAENPLYVTYDDMGLIFLCGKKNVWNRKDNLSDMASLMEKFIFDYDYVNKGAGFGEQLVKDVEEHTGFEHPYLFANQDRWDTLRAVWLSNDQEAYDRLMALSAVEKEEMGISGADPKGYSDILRTWLRNKFKVGLNDPDYIFTNGEWDPESGEEAPEGTRATIPELLYAAGDGWLIIDGEGNYLGMNPGSSVVGQLIKSNGEKIDGMSHRGGLVNRNLIKNGGKYDDGYDDGGRFSLNTGSILNWGYYYQLTRDLRYAQITFDWISILGDTSIWEHWGPTHFLNPADGTSTVAIAYDLLCPAWDELLERGIARPTGYVNAYKVYNEEGQLLYYMTEDQYNEAYAEHKFTYDPSVNTVVIRKTDAETGEVTFHPEERLKEFYPVFDSNDKARKTVICYMTLQEAMEKVPNYTFTRNTYLIETKNTDKDGNPIDPGYSATEGLKESYPVYDSKDLKTIVDCMTLEEAMGKVNTPDRTFTFTNNTYLIRTEYTDKDGNVAYTFSAKNGNNTSNLLDMYNEGESGVVGFMTEQAFQDHKFPYVTTEETVVIRKVDDETGGYIFEAENRQLSEDQKLRKITNVLKLTPPSFPEVTTYDRKHLATIIMNQGVHEGYLSQVHDMTDHPSIRCLGGFEWKSNTDNWNPVCTKGMTLGALMTLEYEEFRSETNAMMDVMMYYFFINGLDEYAPDGAYYESATYWGYGTNAVFMLAAALDSAAGRDYGIMDCYGIDRTCYFAANVESSDAHVWTYNDAGGGTSPNTSGMGTDWFMWVGNYIGDQGLIDHRIYQIENGLKSPSYYDIFTYQPEWSGVESIDLPLSYYMEGLHNYCGAYSVRSSWEKGAMTCSIIGGKNAVAHADVDAGAFMYWNAGKAWIWDLGADNYNLHAFFGASYSGTTLPNRFRYYLHGAEGNNVLTLASKQAVLPFGQRVHGLAPLYRQYADDHGAFAIYDMIDIYSSDPELAGETKALVNSAYRGLLATDDYQTAVLQDEVVAKTAEDFYWFAHFSDATIDATITDDGKVCYMKYKSQDTDPETGEKYYSVLRITIVTQNETGLGYGFYITGAGDEDMVFDATFRNGTHQNYPDQKERDRDTVRRLCIKREKKTDFNAAIVFEMLPRAFYNPATGVVDMAGGQDTYECSYKWIPMYNWQTKAAIDQDFDVEEEETKEVLSVLDLYTYGNKVQKFGNAGTAYTTDFYNMFDAISRVQRVWDKFGNSDMVKPFLSSYEACEEYIRGYSRIQKQVNQNNEYAVKVSKTMAGMR